MVGTSAISGEGLDDLVTAIGRHRSVAFDTESGRRRRIDIARFRLRKTAENLLLERFAQDIGACAAPLVATSWPGATGDPYSLAEELLELIAQRGNPMSEMLDPKSRDQLESEVASWEANEVAAFLKKQAERKPQFFTIGDIPVKRTYTAADIADTPLEDIGLPGRYPFTRGPYPTMYRSRTWTMRQIAGFGTGEDTNRRFQYLIAQGQTGLSTDFDMPTLMGYDSDHPMSEGEVGREGVAVDTLADMEALYDGIDLENISVSMTINPTAWILLAMYVAHGPEARPRPQQALGHDPGRHPQGIHGAEGVSASRSRPSVRIVRDCITFCAENMKRYNPINISGYHISEAGASPLQEAAFTLANAIVYVEEVLKTGMDVDAFAPRLAFFFVSQGDFFEEIAKFRAVRRCYAKIMKERFGAKNPESMRLRFHCQTAAATLTKPQYQINVVRTAMQALSAVLGGCQSLHTNGYDEAFAIPTEDAMRMALRTQQIIAEETNVTNVVDPLGGSYYVESLTNEYEKRMFEILDEVDARGGTIKLIEEGWFQKHIADFAYETALRKQSGEKPVIGVNSFVMQEEEQGIEVHPYDPDTAERQIARTRRVRAERDNAKIAALLDRLEAVARDETKNIMPVTIELVANGATMGDIVETPQAAVGDLPRNPGVLIERHRRTASTLASRDREVLHQPRLGSQPDRRVDGAESLVAAPLDDLEEEAIVEGLRIDLQVLGAAVAVVEDRVPLQCLDPIRRQIGLGLEVVVVVVRDRQQSHAVCLQALDALEDVVGREGDVLHAGAESFPQKA